jgi:integrase
MLKIVQKIPEHISPEYFNDKILSIVDLRFPDYLKIKAILKFMFDTGVRRSEVPLLKRKDFDLENKTVKVYHKKSKKERILPFSKCTKEALEMYFGTYPEKQNAFNIEIENLSRIFKVINKDFPDINFTPHLLRHSCAIACLKAGMDVSYVKTLLGHSRIETTMIYLHVSDEMLQEIYEEKINQNRWTN